MMTLWWANELKSKDDLHLGQVLTIPPVSGLVVTVTANDTLETYAAKYKVDKSGIVKTNDLKDRGFVLYLLGSVVLLGTVRATHLTSFGPRERPVRLHVAERPLGGSSAWPVILAYSPRMTLGSDEAVTNTSSGSASFNGVSRPSSPVRLKAPRG